MVRSTGYSQLVIKGGKGSELKFTPKDDLKERSKSSIAMPMKIKPRLQAHLSHLLML